MGTHSLFTRCTRRSLCVLLGVAVLFVGCSSGGGGAGGSDITGFWSSSYGDGFQVTASSYTQYDNAAGDVSFAGDVVFISEKTAPSGTITVKITAAGTWGYTPGNYTVVKWKSLTSRSVQAAAAAKAPDDVTPSKPTRAEAENAYTEAAGYFAFFGTYEKNGS